jgi:hypothetical protein
MTSEYAACEELEKRPASQKSLLKYDGMFLLVIWAKDVFVHV